MSMEIRSHPLLSVLTGNLRTVEVEFWFSTMQFQFAYTCKYSGSDHGAMMSSMHL